MCSMSVIWHDQIVMKLHRLKLLFQQRQLRSDLHKHLLVQLKYLSINYITMLLQFHSLLSFKFNVIFMCKISAGSRLCLFDQLVLDGLQCKFTIISFDNLNYSPVFLLFPFPLADLLLDGRLFSISNIRRLPNTKY